MGLQQLLHELLSPPALLCPPRLFQASATALQQQPFASVRLFVLPTQGTMTSMPTFPLGTGMQEGPSRNYTPPYSGQDLYLGAQCLGLPVET